VTDGGASQGTGNELRYRRFGGGYRREDVEGALAELRSSMRDLEEDVDALRARSAELEEGLHEARSELDAYRAREGELEQALEAARRALDRASRVEAAVSERGRVVGDAVESLRDGLERLEHAVSEFGGSEDEQAATPSEGTPPTP
jgi:chromosome segregation ATPase